VTHIFLVEPGLNQGGQVVMGSWQKAVELAHQQARRQRRPQIIRGSVPEPRGTIGFQFGRILAHVTQNGAVYPRGPALGDMLTDIACDQTTFARSWRARFNDGMSTAAQAALLGGAAAGLLGAILKRPMFAIAGGAVTAWAAHAIWTAPLRP
jgi:hypothetical protein